jgi:hypothetical protein
MTVSNGFVNLKHEQIIKSKSEATTAPFTLMKSTHVTVACARNHQPTVKR